MPLQVPSYAGDPTSKTAPVANAYADVRNFHLDKDTQTIDFKVAYYRSKADHAAGSAPVNSATYHVTPNVEHRADGVTIPSFVQVILLAATVQGDPVGTLAFSLIDRAIVAFLLSLPEFAGATVVA